MSLPDFAASGFLLVSLLMV